MDLGAFSVSIAVKDLAVSQAFYAKLGFHAMGGNPDHGYVILSNGLTKLGLFQGMFEGNILTFNPGFTQDAEMAGTFTDVRVLRDALVAEGIPLTTDTTQDTPSGPASFTLVDPDGNAILMDQHR